MLNSYLNGEGKIVDSSTIRMKELGISIYNAFPYKSGFIMTGTYKGIEGIYYFDLERSHIDIIYQPDLSGNIFYDTNCIETANNKIFIACDRNIKVFTNNKYSNEIYMSDKGESIHPCQMALNKDGMLACTGNSQYLGLLINNSFKIIKQSETDFNLFGIDDDTDGSFIIRQRGGRGDFIIRYNPKSNKFRALFSIKDTDIMSEDVCVLKDRNLVLNFNHQLKKYSQQGKLLIAGPVYKDKEIISAITYCPKLDYIFALEVHGDILIFDTESLSIVKAISLANIQGQRKDISINENGDLYFITYENMAYKISNQNWNK